MDAFRGGWKYWACRPVHASNTREPGLAISKGCGSKLRNEALVLLIPSCLPSCKKRDNKSVFVSVLYWHFFGKHAGFWDWHQLILIFKWLRLQIWHIPWGRSPELNSLYAEGALAREISHAKTLHLFSFLLKVINNSSRLNTEDMTNVTVFRYLILIC